MAAQGGGLQIEMWLVSDESPMLGQGLLASRQVSESQLCDLRPTTLLWTSVPSSIKWGYSWYPPHMRTWGSGSSERLGDLPRGTQLHGNPDGPEYKPLLPLPVLS